VTGYNQPDYRLNVNGLDITPKVGPRLIELRLREDRGEKADQLDLTLDDADGRMALPPTGRVITLQLGWAGGLMVDKGSYIIDEVEHGGAPDRLQIRARSANMGRGLRLRDSQSWHESTLGAIVGEVASRNGLPAHIDPQLAARVVAHADQTDESDLNFLTRLAGQNDAVCTVKGGALVFLRTGGSTNAAGKQLGTVHIVRRLGDQHRYHAAERTSYKGVRANWYNPRSARRESVVAGGGDEGDDDSDSDVKELKDVYASEDDAARAASSEMQRIDRGQATFSLTLALGQPALMPQSPVSVSGFKKEIDGTAWLVKSVEHSLDERGFTTGVEMELPGSGAFSAQAELGDDEGDEGDEGDED